MDAKIEDLPEISINGKESMDRVELKMAMLNDADCIGKIHSKAWKQSYENIFPREYLDHYSSQTRTQEFLESIDDMNIEYYLGLVKGEPIGIIKIHIYDGNVEIESFYILGNYRGKSYGSQMLEHLLGDRLEDKVYLWVLEENLAARKFYERKGFYNTGKTRVIYRGCEFTQCLYKNKKPWMKDNK